jgi:hypothetical protein
MGAARNFATVEDGQIENRVAQGKEIVPFYPIPMQAPSQDARAAKRQAPQLDGI